MSLTAKTWHLAPKTKVIDLTYVKERIDTFKISADFNEKPNIALKEFIDIMESLNDVEDKEVLLYVRDNLLKKYLERILYAIEASPHDDFTRIIRSAVGSKFFSKRSFNSIYKSIKFAIELKVLWGQVPEFKWGSDISKGAFPDLKVAVFDWGQTLSPLARNSEYMNDFLKLLTKKHGLKICICTAGVTEDQIKLELGDNQLFVSKVWSTEHKASVINAWMEAEGLNPDEFLFADDSLNNFKGFQSDRNGSKIASIKIVPKNDLGHAEPIRGYISSFNEDKPADKHIELWDWLITSLKGGEITKKESDLVGSRS